MKVYASKSKMAMTLLIGFALIAFMGVLTYGAYRTTNPEEGANVFKYLGPLAILGLCYSQFLALKKIFSPLPIIEIDSRGVTINQPYYGFMPWSNITRVHLVQRQVSLTNKIRLLIFEPRDVAEFLAPFKGYALTRVRTGMEQYGGAMMLLSGLPMNPDDFCNAVIEYSQQEIAANVVAPPPA